MSASEIKILITIAVGILIGFRLLGALVEWLGGID